MNRNLDSMVFTSPIQPGSHVELGLPLSLHMVDYLKPRAHYTQCFYSVGLAEGGVEEGPDVQPYERAMWPCPVWVID